LSQDELILSYPISTKTLGECIAGMTGWMDSGQKGRYFVCANPHSLEVARRDPVFDLALRNADLVVPDGVGILVASKVLGGSIGKRITGMDIFLGLSSVLNNGNGCRYFFLGSTAQNLAKLTDKLKADFPNIVVAGTHSPPFTDEFSEEDTRLMVDIINETDPDVLWVGMSAPKQEKWIYQERHRLNVKLIGAVGAVFDFYTGNIKRPRPFFQKTGLEWFVRFFGEPRRLWRRNLVSAPSFLLRVIRCRLTTACKTGNRA
jgi:N-acetylglucosaminyldiphosphoundecaprenol N-acetyl-beta-D-mannosaminyltransferase